MVDPTVAQNSSNATRQADMLTVSLLSQCTRWLSMSRAHQHRSCADGSCNILYMRQCKNGYQPSAPDSGHAAQLLEGLAVPCLWQPLQRHYVIDASTGATIVNVLHTRRSQLHAAAQATGKAPPCRRLYCSLQRHIRMLATLLLRADTRATVQPARACPSA